MMTGRYESSDSFLRFQSERTSRMKDAVHDSTGGVSQRTANEGDCKLCPLSFSFKGWPELVLFP